MQSSVSWRVDLVDQTYVHAPPAVIAAVLTHPRNTAIAWPHVALRLIRDRGDEGAQWAVSGDLTGEFEIWVQPFWDGAIVHHFVRAHAANGNPRVVRRAHVRRWKRWVTTVKDQLEPPRRQWSLQGGESARSLVQDLAGR